ncbi:cytochrome P450 [Micromonospora haikouensis]|uniref:cytochrome P450 n=1 Tax=Micromonospora haikouensis TaxID=686309 RepID=UPI003D7430E1
MSTDFWCNPYPAYHRLRAVSPVIWDDALGAWLVTGARAADTLLRSQQVSSAWIRLSEGTPRTADRDELNRILGDWFMLSDQPEHTGLRRAVHGWFTRSKIESLRPQVRVVVDRTLDGLGPSDQVELVEELASPVAAGAIGAILGVPGELCLSALPNLGRIASFLANPYHEPSAVAAADAFRQLSETLRRAPVEGSGGLLEGLHDAGWSQYAATATLLLFAGQETTTGLISTGLLYLMGDDESRLALANGEVTAEEVVMELLRFDTPVPQVPRVALADINLEGELIRTGDRIIIFIAAANRDPAAATDPDRLDVRRSDLGLAFGAGPHFCLGAALARVTGEEAISAWVRRFPDAKPVGPGAVWLTSKGYRALASLTVATNRFSLQETHR